MAFVALREAGGGRVIHVNSERVLYILPVNEERAHLVLGRREDTLDLTVEGSAEEVAQALNAGG
jgi:hypothetical protein